MLLNKIGEFGLIDRFKKLIKLDSSVIKGTGDDCAVLEFNKSRTFLKVRDKDEYLLFTCDMLVEGIDFNPQESPYLIGRKSLAVSISDIAACAGIPHYCLVSLSLPKKTPVEFVDKLFKGVLALAKKYKINIVGGDISRARQLVIDVSMLGSVEKKYLVLRSGARRGDIIFVSGRLGGSIFAKHLKFNPRLKEARFLAKNFKVSSMIDISDGLIQDLTHLLRESKVGAIIYEGLIPVNKKARNLEDALYMGEDFELLFTMSPSQARKLLQQKRLNIFKPIGEIVEEKIGLRLIDKQGKEKIVKLKGFRHF